MSDTDRSDDLIRELPRIARYARRSEAEDSRFRVYLKTGLPLSNRELDAAVQEIAEPVCRQIDCTACANCCRTFEIVVDDKDIARLSKRLGLSLKAFAARYVTVEADRTKRFSTIPCPMLGDDGLCTVYDDRPRACRDYPYVQEPHFRSRSLSMLENAGQCPIVFNVWRQLKRRFPVPPRARR